MKNNLLHQRLLDNMQKNIDTLSNILATVSAAQAASWRDGPDGWTILEVVCHLRDYDEIFLERGQLTTKQDNPTYPVYDHLALVVERAYNEQEMNTVLAELKASRKQLIAFFTELSVVQWQRTGDHVAHGRYTMEGIAAHVAWHDANHLEQITRIIAESP